MEKYLHGVINRKACCDNTARGVYVQMDLEKSKTAH
jgi:hypothetical protein